MPGSTTDYGKLRVKVRADEAKPVFVGIARTSDVDTYLDRSAHATLTDFDVDPFVADYRTTGGLTAPAAPGTQSIWASKAAGTGTQTLTWNAEDGDWSVVVMNADGSAGVDTEHQRRRRGADRRRHRHRPHDRRHLRDRDRRGADRRRPD